MVVSVFGDIQIMQLHSLVTGRYCVAGVDARWIASVCGVISQVRDRHDILPTGKRSFVSWVGFWIAEGDATAAAIQRPIREVGGRKARWRMAILRKAAAKSAEPEKRKPDFIVRAKVRDDVWVSIGAAWSAQLKGGVTGYSLKINTFPANWSGDALLMPPLETEE